MNYQLLVNGEFLDLTPDFNIAINKSIADIREPENREDTWTKTFTLPGTQKNKQIFGHLYHLNYSITATTQFTPDFNPNIRAEAELWVDTIPQVKGYIRLVDISVVDENEIEFECTIHGMVADLFSTIGENLLSALDFSEYNHPLSFPTVSGSWDTSIVIDGINEPFELGRGYVYGMIDDGTYSNYTDILLNSFKPMLYAKTVLDKILSLSGFSYTADSFFNTETFKRLVVPCPIGAPISTGNEFIGNITVNKSVSIAADILFDTETDPAGQFDPASGALQLSTFGGQVYNLYFRGSATVTGLTASRLHKFTIGVYRNGSLIATNSSLFLSGGGSATFDFSTNFTNVQIASAAIYTLRVASVEEQNPTTFAYTSVTPASITINSGSTFFNTIVSSYGVGVEVDFTTFFPGEFKQKDFIKGLFNMFNLYAEPDPDEPTKLYIESYKDFYDGSTRDWSNKLDYSQALVITPMGELNANPYTFTYQEGDDTPNQEYKKTYSRLYGDLTAKIENDFVRNERKIEIPFASTLCRTLGDKSFAYCDKLGKMRILYYGGTETAAIYNVVDDLYWGAGVPTKTTSTTYPKVLHVDDPISPTIDILFGTPREVGLPGNVTYSDNNIYNAYWSQYIAEISDANSKIVTGFFDITPADMEKLTFRDVYFFENSYFVLNKIEDYTPEKLTKCEFLQIQEAIPFTPSTEDVGEGVWNSGDRVLRIGELPIGAGFTDIATNTGVESLAYGTAAFASASGLFTGSAYNSVMLGCSGITVTESNKVFINNNPFNLFNPASGDTVTFRNGEFVSYNTKLDNYVNITANYTVTSGVDTVIADANNNLVTLPDPTTVGGRTITVIGGEGLTTTVNSTAYNGEAVIETLDGAAAFTFFSDFTDWHVKSDGNIAGVGGATTLNDLTDVNIGLSITTPVDADDLLIQDSAGLDIWKKLSWANLKATLKTYFDTLYQAAGAYLTSANITATITNGVTDKAPSEDAVFDALALKEPVITNGFGITGTTTKAVSLTTAQAFATAETTLSATTYADITGASISLAAGTWMIFATINGSSQTTTVAVMIAAITDSSNTLIAEGAQHIVAGTATVRTWGNVTLSAIVTPASTTTYKLRGAKGQTTQTGNWIASDGTGQGTANNVSNNSDKSTSIRAIRIA
jgi:hypothetical protein